MVFAGYTEEGKKESVRPAADICYFINSKIVETLAKNKDTVALLDKHCLETLGPLLDKMSENMHFEEARAVAIRFVVALVRAAIGKKQQGLGVSSREDWRNALGRGEDHGDEEVLGHVGRT